MRRSGGVRIRHKTLKSILLVVRDKSRPIPNPRNKKVGTCRTCGVPHDVKTYHLPLDSEGCVIVSTTIYEKLLSLADHAGFELVNAVAKPPAQKLVLPKVDQKVKAFDPIRRDFIHAEIQ
jgi:hypothetical protein